jgi:hypothetical protein
MGQRSKSSGRRFAGVSNRAAPKPGYCVIQLLGFPAVAESRQTAGRDSSEQTNHRRVDCTFRSPSGGIGLPTIPPSRHTPSPIILPDVPLRPPGAPLVGSLLVRHCRGRHGHSTSSHDSISQARKSTRGSRGSHAGGSICLLRDPSATVGSSAFDDDFSTVSRHPSPPFHGATRVHVLSQNSLSAHPTASQHECSLAATSCPSRPAGRRQVS